jgi:methyl-accepting chemotaxis protein
MIFKLNGYQGVLSGDSTKEFKDHKSCKFSKWYKENSTTIFSKTSSFKNLEIPHKSVHDNIRYAIKLISKDGISKNNEQDIIKLFNNAEYNSNQLFDILDDVIEQTSDEKDQQLAIA